MNHALGLAIESLVAVLLVLTIGYCMLLNARLKRLKADEHSLKAVIAELITATEIAERDNVVRRLSKIAIAAATIGRPGRGAGGAGAGPRGEGFGSQGRGGRGAG